jgi:hypothetical protein
MTLPLGCRLTVAPRFHLEPDWAARLAVGAGVQEADGRFFPRGPWRPLSAAEINLLIAGPEDGLQKDAETGCLFQIPGHLKTAWWDLLDKSVEAGVTALPGFEDFTRQVAEFLRFKHLEVPPSLQMEAVVTAAGRCSMRSDPQTGAPAGLGPSLASWAEYSQTKGVPRLWAVVNLGDEDTSLVLIASPIQGLPAHLALRHPGQPPPTTVGELVNRFLRECPDTPPIRLRLGPGEGFRLPAAGLILDGDPTDKLEPDVLLLITQQPSAEPEPSRP